MSASTELLVLAQARIDAEAEFRMSLYNKLQQDIADRPCWRSVWNVVVRTLR